MLLLAQHAVAFAADGKKTITLSPGQRPQDVPDWVALTPTFLAAKRGGQIAVLSGMPEDPKSRKPPTIEEVKAAGYSDDRAKQIVEEETLKFERGDWPYPPRNPAQMNDRAKLAATGLSEEEIGRVLAKRAAQAVAPEVPVDERQKLINGGLTGEEADEIIAARQKPLGEDPIGNQEPDGNAGAQMTIDPTPAVQPSGLGLVGADATKGNGKGNGKSR